MPWTPSRLVVVGVAIAVLPPSGGSSLRAFPAQEGSSQAVLLDAHSHDMANNRDATGAPITPSAQIERFRSVGLTGAVVISHDPDVLEAYRAVRAPHFAVSPFVNMPRAADGGAQLNAARVQRVAEALRSGIACGVGELPLRQDFPSGPDDATDLNHPLLGQIYDHAAAYQAPVLMHVQVMEEEAAPLHQRGHRSGRSRRPRGTATERPGVRLEPDY